MYWYSGHYEQTLSGQVEGPANGCRLNLQVGCCALSFIEPNHLVIARH